MSVVIATVGAVLAIVGSADPASASGQGPAGGFYQLGNVSSFGGLLNTARMCLDTYAPRIGNYQPIVQWGCDRSRTDAFENWTVTDVGSGLYQLTNSGGGICLDSDARRPYSGSDIIQFACNSSDPYQLWYINPAGGGAWSIKNLGASNRAYQLGYTDTGLCLDADSTQQENGGRIQQYNCDTGDGFQLWYMFDATTHPH
jgi:hypothetical protein